MSEVVCYWTGSDTPRALVGRHETDCESRDCRGCEPCPDRHCIVCGREHVDRVTCARCISTTRSDLDEIAWLCRHLRYQAGHTSRDTEPHKDHVLGGDAMAMMVGANHDGSGSDYSASTDPMPPLATLATWEDDWRSTFGHGPAGRATIHGARRYLTRNLHHAAQHHLAFDEFVTEVRQTRAALEDVLHDGVRDETGAPCPMCGKAALVKSYGDSEADDRWCCRKCRQWYSDADYRSKVQGTYEQVASALTASAIFRVYRVHEGTVRVWASRGKVRKRGLDGHGLQLYDVADVLEARGNNETEGGVCAEVEVL